MTSLFPSQPRYKMEALNHFHEYTKDIEELFEVRELTPPLIPPKSEEPPASAAGPRLGVIKKVLAKVKGRKNVKPLTPPPEEEEEDWNKYGELPGGRAGTFPRMNKVDREAELKDMRDEMFGQGKYERKLSARAEMATTGSPASPSQHGRDNHVTFEDIEPEPFVWRYRGPESDDEDERSKPEDRKWEEFVLPDSPEYASEGKDTTTTTGKQPTFGYIPIDLSEIPPERFGRESNSSLGSGSVKSITECKKSPPSEPPRKTPTNQPIKVSNALCDNCGKRFCLGSPVHVLTPEEVIKNLGADVAKHIVTELALRSGAPVPLPPRNLEETAKSTLSIRDPPVVHTYAMWASIFMFQKLILSIIRNVDKFTPSYDGALQLEFEHYPVFRNIDPKSRLLIINKMSVIWSKHVYILESSAPRDGAIRTEWIGEPFWARKQAYKMTMIGAWDGILIKYHIRRGMPDDAHKGRS